MERIKTGPTKPPSEALAETQTVMNGMAWGLFTQSHFGVLTHEQQSWRTRARNAGIAVAEMLALLWQFALSPQLLELCTPWRRLGRAALPPRAPEEMDERNLTDSTGKATAHSARGVSFFFFKAFLVGWNWWECLKTVKKNIYKNMTDRLSFSCVPIYVTNQGQTAVNMLQRQRNFC